MMEHQPSPELRDLSDIPVELLSKEIKLRHFAEAADQSLVEHIAESDGLAPLLNMIIGHVIPLI